MPLARTAVRLIGALVPAAVSAQTAGLLTRDCTLGKGQSSLAP
jgi:hypothetical protein